MEGTRQVVTHPGDGDMVFLHGLKKGRLGAGAGAVDLVGHHHLAEDGTRHEAELALARVAFLQDFRAQNIGGHQVGGELDALFGKTQNPAKRCGQLGLGKPRCAHQQGMAAAQDGGEGEFDHLRLAEDHPANGAAHIFEALPHGFEFAYDLPVGFIDACHWSHYSLQCHPREREWLNRGGLVSTQ
jgi:hypothetical protein